MFIIQNTRSIVNYESKHSVGLLYLPPMDLESGRRTTILLPHFHRNIPIRTVSCMHSSHRTMPSIPSGLSAEGEAMFLSGVCGRRGRL